MFKNQLHREANIQLTKDSKDRLPAGKDLVNHVLVQEVRDYLKNPINQGFITFIFYNNIKLFKRIRLTSLY